MAIPKLDNQNILDAFKYIDENGVPNKYKSTQYDLVLENGKKYPPKYVISVASHFANGTEIGASTYNAVEAKDYFMVRGYSIVVKQEKYELIITADSVSSTDERFTMDDLTLGDGYKPLDAYFSKESGETIHRAYNKGERRNTNQTLPRLVCQVFESSIDSLSDWDKEKFPVSRFTADSEIVRGIYSSVEEYRKHRNTIEYLVYSRENGPQFVFYSWNIFSTIVFIQECLKRFGDAGDKAVLIYREKTEQEKNLSNDGDSAIIEELELPTKGSTNKYSKILLQSKNIILRGAPGTGKTYLAKEIAADIISDGYYQSYSQLSDEQKKQIEFVQFHPSYDYSDFVEGLRPKMNPDGSMGFELQEGIFTRFVNKAKKNYEDSQKTKEMIAKEASAREALSAFLADVDLGIEEFYTIKGSKFYITGATDNHIDVSIPGNDNVNKLSLNTEEVIKMLESGLEFEKIADITRFFNKQFATQGYSYDFAIFKAIKERGYHGKQASSKQEELKKFIFIIDEINRGEISKILGELFFSIDPGYRGTEGSVSTQYANMHANPDEKFYIPENVYIIGTMNDIDRSVDSFDFAMRRRFRFVEVTAEDSMAMLDEVIENEEIKQDIIKRMTALNEEIKNVDDLDENYQIGAAYFKRLNSLTFDELWTDCLRPVLQDYVRGMYEEKEIMKRFAKAYGYVVKEEENIDEN